MGLAVLVRDLASASSSSSSPSGPAVRRLGSEDLLYAAPTRAMTVLKRLKFGLCHVSKDKEAKVALRLSCSGLTRTSGQPSDLSRLLGGLSIWAVLVVVRNQSMVSEFGSAIPPAWCSQSGSEQFV